MKKLANWIDGWPAKYKKVLSIVGIFFYGVGVLLFFGRAFGNWMIGCGIVTGLFLVGFISDKVTFH